MRSVPNLTTFDSVLNDRGSKYAVSGCACDDASQAAIIVKTLRAKSKKFQKATHHSWAMVRDGEIIKNDDGESGAGMVIGRVLLRAGVDRHVVIVSRWYGGKHLGGDRFRHVLHATQYFLNETGLAAS
ncbi:MAG: YigZ family protein [Pseudomonadota bacterium]